MDPIVAPPATPPSPAAPVTPTPTPTPEQAAFEKRDFKGWQDARKAEQAGTPPPTPAPVTPPVEAKKPEPPAAPPPPKKISLTQDELNERTRRAVEAALRDAQAKPPAPSPAAAPPPPAPPPVEKFPTIEDWSKTNPTGTLNDYLDARDTWRDERRTAAAKAQAEHQGRLTELKTRADQFREKVTTAIAADAEFVNKIPADVFAATPLSGLSREAIQAGKATFANVAAEAAFRSADPAKFLIHLHAHPDDVRRIAALPPGEWLVELAVLDRSLRTASPPSKPAPPAAAPAPAPESTISAAPPPPPTVSTPGSTADPEADAFKRHDFKTWQAIKAAQRRARVTGAA